MHIKKITLDHKILNYTILILIILLFLPSVWTVEGGILLGYPISYLTIYDSIMYMKSYESILFHIKIDIIILIINVVIIYKILSIIDRKLKK